MNWSVSSRREPTASDCLFEGENEGSPQQQRALFRGPLRHLKAFPVKLFMMCQEVTERSLKWALNSRIGPAACHKRTSKSRMFSFSPDGDYHAVTGIVVHVGMYYNASG